MLRAKALIPLSHQHQHALALCVRIDRALKRDTHDLGHWQDEISRLFESEIRYHFESEEKVLFPVAAARASLAALVNELTAEHQRLREFASGAAAHDLTAADLQAFADTLAAHVRKEERHLFEAMQELLSAPELQRLGEALDYYFRNSGMPGASCELKQRL